MIFERGHRISAPSTITDLESLRYAIEQTDEERRMWLER